MRDMTKQKRFLSIKLNSDLSYIHPFHFHSFEFISTNIVWKMIKSNINCVTV